MASPQVENGYVRIATELLEHTLVFEFPSASPLKIFLFILRKTYGYKKLFDFISLTQIQSGTKLSRPTVIQSIDWLIRANLVFKKEQNQRGTKLGINKDWESWVVNTPLLVNPPCLLVVKSNAPGGKPVFTHNKYNTINNNTVANATASIKLNNEITPMSEIEYVYDNPPKGKSKHGSKTMAWLASKYLEARDIVIAPGETYDAGKISKGLSKLYQECKKDPDETARRIVLGGEYFNTRGLDWTPEAVWRRWEDIDAWEKADKPSEQKQRDSKRKLLNLENNPLYE